MKSKKYAIYVKKSFVRIKTRKKPQIIAITLENLEQLLRVNASYNVRYKVSKEIAVVFHNGSTYDYHFVIKKLAK